MPITACSARASVLAAMLALGPASKTGLEAQTPSPAWALPANNKLIFMPDTFAFPGAEFDLAAAIDVTWSGAAAAWSLNTAARLTLSVPPKPGAEAVVVTLNGNWAGTSGQFFVDITQDAVGDSVMHRKFGSDAFQFNHALVLRGPGKVKVTIRPDGQGQPPFLLQSIVVFFVKGV